MTDFKVYIFRDAEAIESLVNDSFDGLITAAVEGYVPDLEVVNFTTEAEAVAFCDGIHYGLEYGIDSNLISNLRFMNGFKPDGESFIILLLY